MPIRRRADCAHMVGPFIRPARRQVGCDGRALGRRRRRVALPSFVERFEYAGPFGRSPPGRAGDSRGSRKFHHYGRDGLGPCPRGRAPRGQGDCLDGNGHVRGLCGGRALRDCPLRQGRIRRGCSGDSRAPLITLLLIAPLRGAAPAHKNWPGILSVISRLWLPGVGAALSSVGFGAIIAFSSLLFVEHDWMPVWLAFTAYAAALIAARLLFGHLPDRIGGAQVALVSALVEAIGLALMGYAGSAALATLGAALTGLGYALAFQAFGV